MSRKRGGEPARVSMALRVLTWCGALRTAPPPQTARRPRRLPRRPRRPRRGRLRESIGSVAGRAGLLQARHKGFWCSLRQMATGRHRIRATMPSESRIMPRPKVLANRQIFGRWMMCAPSRFVAELPPDHIERESVSGAYYGDTVTADTHTAFDRPTIGNRASNWQRNAAAPTIPTRAHTRASVSASDDGASVRDADAQQRRRRLTVPRHAHARGVTRSDARRPFSVPCTARSAWT